MGRSADRRRLALAAAGTVSLVVLAAIFTIPSGMGRDLRDATGHRLELLDASNLDVHAVKRLTLSDVKDAGLRALGIRDLKDPRLKQVRLYDLREHYWARIPLELIRDKPLDELTVADLKNVTWLNTPPPLTIPGDRIASAMTSVDQAQPGNRSVQAEQPQIAAKDAAPKEQAVVPLVLPNKVENRHTQARVIPRTTASRPQPKAAKPQVARARTRTAAPRRIVRETASAPRRIARETRPAPRRIARATPAPKRRVAVERRYAYPAARNMYEPQPAPSIREYSRVYRNEVKKYRKNYKQKIRSLIRDIF